MNVWQMKTYAKHRFTFNAGIMSGMEFHVEAISNTYLSKEQYC